MRGEQEVRRKLAESVQEKRGAVERQQHVFQHVCVVVCPLQNTEPCRGFLNSE